MAAVTARPTEMVVEMVMVRRWFRESTPKSPYPLPWRRCETGAVTLHVSIKLVFFASEG